MKITLYSLCFLPIHPPPGLLQIYPCRLSGVDLGKVFCFSSKQQRGSDSRWVTLFGAAFESRKQMADWSTAYFCSSSLLPANYFVIFFHQIVDEQFVDIIFWILQPVYYPGRFLSNFLPFVSLSHTYTNPDPPSSSVFLKVGDKTPLWALEVYSGAVACTDKIGGFSKRF